MENRILVVLGSPNFSKGELSITAIERLNTCFHLFTKNDLILCTGGWGEHFNTCKNPHAYFAKEYLLKKGVSKNNFLPFALSNNTVEDAVKTKEIITDKRGYNITIITSNYHLERVQLIFNVILKKVTLNYLGVNNMILKGDLERAIIHEKNAIKVIKKNRLYW